MISVLLSRFGWLEVVLRHILWKFPKLKAKAKKRKKRGERKQPDERAWNEYKNKIEKIIGENEIVLIHSSMDGLSKIGVPAKDVIFFLLRLVDKGNTIVLPTFPVTNLRLSTLQNLPYDPEKTLCWTGMLPNLFIGTPGVIRSIYPYNSLAAIGPMAEEMMRQNYNAYYVYDEMSAWAFCVNHHAKILFLGTPASGSNTIGIHMVPDLMKDKWPIADWYDEVICKIRVNGQVSEKKIKVQKGCWYRYCMENLTSSRLVRSGNLIEENVNGCYLGYVNDSLSMVSTLESFCNNGKLMYLIPKNNYKNKRKKL